MSDDDVRALLHDILGRAEFTGSAQLDAQVSTITSISGPLTMIDISVSDVAPRASVDDGPIPSIPVVVDASGDHIGELLVWVSNGRLSALEYAWWTDAAPTSLPAVSQLRL